ncbi:oligosaccharide flippase family protein [Clostridium folliculivorans]|uniref:Heteropolysaccharide repeat-containing protein n=1 Tax=Clostridium folliculivorans TaxID=2886038 RepID=A0A9W5Y5L2_9CLOT|nr:oligosaccharide flippase family protein [Clostridium folliculivorans]GKU26918.1 heteropolysaccharide repeat-containing protein [Clostridium folliculivorans]GKU31569.1 heteropolysaccharide repeat-containing protein [Clostridium folliculivorans]
MSKSIAKNTIYSILLRIFNIIVPVIIGAYPIRVFGPELMGRIAYSESIYNYFMIFASFGIYNYALRELSKIRDDKEKLNKTFTSLFLFGIITHVTVFVIYLSYVLLNFNGKPQFFVLLIFSITMLQDSLYTEWVNEALENYDFITFKTIIIRIINIILLFTLVKNKSDFYVYVSLTTITFILNNITSFIYIKRRIGFDFSGLSIFKHIKPLIFVLLISNAYMLYTQFDKIMLGIYNGESEVGFYNICQMIITLINPMLLSIVYVTIPRLSNISEESEENYLNLLNKVSKFYFAFMFPAAIGLFSLAKEIIMLYAKSEFLPSVPVLRAFSIFLISMGIEYILTNQIIYVKRKEKYLVGFLIICGLINIILKVIILKLGILRPETAVITTLISNIVLVILEYSFIKIKMKVNFNLLSLDKVRYLIISLMFIPITMLIKLYINNLLFIAIVAMLINGSLYAFILYVIKDETIFTILSRFGIGTKKH